MDYKPRAMVGLCIPSHSCVQAVAPGTLTVQPGKAKTTLIVLVLTAKSGETLSWAGDTGLTGLCTSVSHSWIHSLEREINLILEASRFVKCMEMGLS